MKAYNKNITFCAWGTKTEEIPECDIIFGHFEINGFYMSKVKSCTKGVDSKSILEKAPLVMSGHFHIRETRVYKDGRRIVYTGSPYELNWGDYGTASRGFYILDVETSQEEFVENTESPKHKRIRLSEIKSAGTITDAIKREFPNNFVILIIDQDVKVDVIERLLEVLNGFGAVNIKTDYIMENRIGIGEGEHNFDGVDLVQSITDFVNVVENMNYKDEVLKYTIKLYNECKK